MNGLMMDYQLTVPTLLRRAEALYQEKEIVSRRPDKSLHRYRYAEMVDRSKRLALGLRKLGIASGDRVGTLLWNQHQHLEAYFGVPAAGAVLHTLNLRLHEDDLAYIAGHGEDRAVLVDETLWELFEKFRDRVGFEHVIWVGTPGGTAPKNTIDYESLLDAEDPAAFEYPELDERQAAAMCYTSGTTGRPKGVLYTHRAMVLHSIAACLADTLAVCEADTVLPVVPMFHANAWGLPYAAAMVGSKQVLPGPYLDPADLLELMAAERVTLTAGVPTIWLGMLQLLDQQPSKYDLSALRSMVVGGSAAPRSLIQGLWERHKLRVVHAWGMTELSPLGTISVLPSHLRQAPAEVQYDRMARQGPPIPMVEVRGRSEQGLIPWDGKTMGELEVRGACVASAYYRRADAGESFTEDGWFRTGDIVAIEPDGCVHLQDRAKDVIKSGGEWISSVALENALMGHPAVAEAAVIPVAHPKWDERPLAVVVLKPDASATPDELIDSLRPHFAKWWLPDAVELVDEIPKTSAGKFMKSTLRERFQGRYG